jgi:hypothetical protein
MCTWQSELFREAASTRARARAFCRAPLTQHRVTSPPNFAVHAAAFCFVFGGPGFHYRPAQRMSSLRSCVCLLSHFQQVSKSWLASCCYAVRRPCSVSSLSAASAHVRSFSPFGSQYKQQCAMCYGLGHLSHMPGLATPQFQGRLTCLQLARPFLLKTGHTHTPETSTHRPIRLPTRSTQVRLLSHSCPHSIQSSLQVPCVR